ncbi:MAG: hypothetical protein BMS9Abin28_1031 [Anaerolineae bacterium]|nr:MAG: hypothetical protein BMS9Abin28_1031 [Anaerolineae bacterium]
MTKRKIQQGSHLDSPLRGRHVNHHQAIRSPSPGGIRVGLLPLLGLLAIVACTPQQFPTPASTEASTATPTSPPRYTFRIVNTYPHDPGAFTQGLVYEDGFLYEGTGLRGQSTLRRVDLSSGEVAQSLALDPELFGEGITLFGDRIIQLTFTSGLGFVYDQQSFSRVDEFSYTPEGWGLTHDGRQLIMSDGTAELRFLDPDSFQETARLTVADGNLPVRWLNELEYVEGEIYANVWQTDLIVRISPDTGEVLGWIDLAGLRRDEPPAGVLNGIAYDSEGRRLFVTGKNWPELFEIELIRE